MIHVDALERARTLAQAEGGSLGEHLVAAGLVADDALTEFYRTRLLVPQVNPNTLAKLPDEVIALIPAEMAIDLRVIPVSLTDGITIAMGDPSSRVAVDEVSAFTGKYVIRAVATQLQLAWCLAHYYGHVTALGRRLVSGQSDEEAAPAVESTPAPAPAPRRQRGLTSKVAAARHRGLPPVTRPVDVPRPDSSVLDDPTPAASSPGPAPAATTPAAMTPAAEATPAPLVAAATPAAPTPATTTPRPAARAATNPVAAPLATARVRTVTGEIAIAKSQDPTREVTLSADELDSGPVVTIEVSDAFQPKRRNASWRDPPELATRSGELESKGPPPRALTEEPAVVISRAVQERVRARADAEDPAAERSPAVGRPAPRSVPLEEAPVRVRVQEDVAIVTSQPLRSSVVHAEASDDESGPILLAPKRPSRAGAAEDVPQAIEHPEPSEVVLLEQPKLHALEPLPPTTPSPAVNLIPEPPIVAAPREVPRVSGRRPERRTQLGLGIEPSAAPTPEAPGRAARDTEVSAIPPMPDQAEPAEPASPPATRSEAASGERPLARASRRATPADVDDGWGPPGTTIPPPWLGAIPGGMDAVAVPGSVIPISDESGPLLIAPANPPQHSSRWSATAPPVATGQDLVAELQAATERVVELVRNLEQAADRDQIIDLLVAYLSDSHHRAGFLTIRQDVLSVFRVAPSPLTLPAATVKLDGPSTFKDVAAAALPYRGPVSDDVSRRFLTELLGDEPAEILLAPIVLRERPVGLLFAERRKRHTFDEQLVVACRAAATALERVLRAKRER
ncbi:MAG: hypothetical protein R3B48_16660 [Kofleriaceae bacterium]